jgi:hypothetical protein
MQTPDLEKRPVLVKRLSENERINFNAGDHSISVSLRFTEYLQMENPNLATLTTQQQIPPPSIASPSHGTTELKTSILASILGLC